MHETVLLLSTAETVDHAVLSCMFNIVHLLLAAEETKLLDIAVCLKIKKKLRYQRNKSCSLVLIYETQQSPRGLSGPVRVATVSLKLLV
jgi:hypothetical protein